MQVIRAGLVAGQVFRCDTGTSDRKPSGGKRQYLFFCDKIDHRLIDNWNTDSYKTYTEFEYYNEKFDQKWLN